MISVTTTALCVAALGLAACGRLSVAETDQGGAGGGGTGSAGAGGGLGAHAAVPSACSPAGSLAPARIVLLTDAQYVNAVRDVFSVEVGPEVTTVRNASGQYPFAQTEAAQVSTAMVQAYFRASDQVGSKLQPCAADAAPDVCIEEFLRSKLPIAWRRPVTDDEITSIVSLFH